MLTLSERLVADNHIWQLANSAKVGVRRSRAWDTSEAEWSIRKVFIPRHTLTALDYLVALHEIGHIVLELEHDDPEPLTAEARAWDFALRVANQGILDKMTKTDWRRMGLCWASHVGPVF